MRVLIIGGGKVGSYLARELVGEGHIVTVIEEELERARELADSHDVTVFHGDGTDVRLLKSADIHRVDLVLGVTGRDEANLVACQLALALDKDEKIRVLARLNDPGNRDTFEALNIDVVAVTDLMVHIISQQVELADLQRIAIAAGASVSMIERTIGPGVPDLPLAELPLPPPALLVAVVRGDDVFVPTAMTRLRPDDRVVAVTSLDNERRLCDALDEISVGGDA